MEHRQAQSRASKLAQSLMGTFKLSAKPSLIPDGQFKGELRSVAFLATSLTKTLHWFVINCGQFEKAFSKLIPRWLATEKVDALRRGECVEFPGLYREEQFDCGFHYEWSAVSSDLPACLVYAGQTA